MATKIKFSFVKMFFRLFSFLADKTGGWKIFVQPKLVLGTMIIGFGVAACNSAGKAKSDNNAVTADTTEIAQGDIDTIIADTAIVEVTEPATCNNTTKTNKQKKAKAKPPEIDEDYSTCYVILYEPTCYKVSAEPPEKQTVVPDTVYESRDVDKKAEFPGGNMELMKWLNDNLEYPYIAMDNNIQGKVFVKFIVRKDGSIDNIQVERGVHQSLDKGATNLIKRMPIWQPAEKNGVIVSSYFTLPVTFVLKQ